MAAEWIENLIELENLRRFPDKMPAVRSAITQNFAPAEVNGQQVMRFTEEQPKDTTATFIKLTKRALQNLGLGGNNDAWAKQTNTFEVTLTPQTPDKHYADRDHFVMDMTPDVHAEVLKLVEEVAQEVARPQPQLAAQR